MKNIKEYATIHIVNLQTSDGQENRTEFRSSCEFYENDDVFFITYKEPEGVGTDCARVFLKIRQNSVLVRRMGEFKSIMPYDEGKITDAVYETPFGKVDIRINTRKIENEIKNSGGSLRINYTLLAAGDEIENEILLEIKKEQKR